MRASLCLLLAALASSGCMVNRYSSDPNARMDQLLNESEDLKKIRDEYERIRMKDQQSHLALERVQGGIPDESAKAKLTVANVLKEEAMLFAVDPKGELTFVRKLPHGEAADIDARPGQRYAAVFSGAPHQMGFEVKDASGTWLLRKAVK